VVLEPAVVVEHPVVVGRPKVVVREKVVVSKEKNDCSTKCDPDTSRLFKRLRSEKKQLLRRLRIGDKDERRKAISELAGFSFDERVREALEKVVLGDPDPELRMEAIKSFAKVKNKGALPVLEKVRVEDSDKEVRQEADKAIKAIQDS
jgi:HEAT repeat protein